MYIIHVFDTHVIDLKAPYMYVLTTGHVPCGELLAHWHRIITVPVVYNGMIASITLSKYVDVNVVVLIHQLIRY